jgi:hypothetical protein
MSDALGIAIEYIQRGWAPIPIPFRQKGPTIQGWQSLRLTAQTAPAYFNGAPQNIGVLMGPASDHLTDVDLDCGEAIAAAPLLLPPTIRFGRTTTRGAHWLYYAEFPATAKAVLAFDDPIVLRSNAKAARLVELRSGADGKGCQTVFPGSVHESGEPIDWESPGGHSPPTAIDNARLADMVARVAAAALLARYWPPKGNRHDLSLALGGALARGGWDIAAIEDLVAAVASIAGDPRPADRVRCARDAAEAVANGKPAYGFPKLKEILGDAVAGKLAEWLGLAHGGAARGGTVIRLGADLTAAAEAAEAAMLGAGLPLFRHGNTLVRPVILDARGVNDQPIKTIGLEQIPPILMRSYMEQAARFEKYDGRTKKWKTAKPPEDIADLILARAGHWPFPPIRGVLAAQSMRPDGSIIETAGYDALTAMYLFNPPPMPDIPERPTKSEGGQALEILDDLLKDFPWQGDDDARAVALSALITPVVRPAMPTAPMHAANAPEAGSGKSYLFQLAAAIATGFPCPVISTGKDEEELEKRLGTVLIAGHALFSIDNISHPLGGDYLCQLLEQPLIKVRVLGKTAGPLVEPRVCLFATGNNLTLVGDIVRRAVTAYMDAGREDPWMRQFNDDPLERIMADRGKYIAAALTVCRAYMASGEAPLPPLQSFEAWSRVVRSALVWLGTGDPVKTIAKAAADDPGRQAFDAVLTSWSNIFQETERTAAEVIARAKEQTVHGGYANEDLRNALLTVAAGKGGEISAHRLGAWLRDHRDRVLGRRCLQRRAGPNKVTLWSVVHR